MSTTNVGSASRGPTDVIPGPQQPWHMSLQELAIALSLHEPGTRRSAAVEEELRRRLLRETDPAPRTPPTIAFLIGALVTVTAIQVGAVMRAVPAGEHRVAAPSSQMSGQSPASPQVLRS